MPNVIIEVLSDGLCEMPSDLSWEMKAEWLEKYLNEHGFFIIREFWPDA